MAKALLNENLISSHKRIGDFVALGAKRRDCGVAFTAGTALHCRCTVSLCRRKREKTAVLVEKDGALTAAGKSNVNIGASLGTALAVVRETSVTPSIVANALPLSLAASSADKQPNNEALSSR
jgi:hypothetical protein